MTTMSVVVVAMMSMVVVAMIVVALGSALALTEWATLAQGLAGWRPLETKPPFDIDKPHMRQPRCDTWVPLEAEQRRALFDAAAVADMP
mmetsp:Transcript_65959/g.123419  ORF Transcript_65959/g.123419 Transcript_65959/m.123419 type:complete len:89 (-) Transcript_65959:52-318(-)